jgi:hypothetical protein
MRAMICLGGALVAFAVATRADAQEDSDRAAVQKVLTQTIKYLEPKVKDDKKALRELNKLRKTKDHKRMAAALKKEFKIDTLDADGVKKANAVIKKLIDARSTDELKKMLANRDTKVIRPLCCFLWGCD